MNFRWIPGTVETKPSRVLRPQGGGRSGRVGVEEREHPLGNRREVWGGEQLGADWEGDEDWTVNKG